MAPAGLAPSVEITADEMGIDPMKRLICVPASWSVLDGEAGRRAGCRSARWPFRHGSTAVAWIVSLAWNGAEHS